MQEQPIAATEIRKATIFDIPDIHALVRELAEYEKSPDQVIASVEDYQRDFRSGCFEAVVAVQQSEIRGMALFFRAYSTWKGRMLYLDDLVVSEPFRRRGLGGLLFQAVLNEARSQGAKLLKWQVLDWNEPALQFYKSYDAVIESEWYNGKILLHTSLSV
jgi:GNAT superfamily N-acetyltransferase